MRLTVIISGILDIHYLDAALATGHWLFNLSNNKTVNIIR